MAARYGLAFQFEQGYYWSRVHLVLPPAPAEDPKRLSVCDQKRLELVAKELIPDIAKMVLDYARLPCCPEETTFGLIELVSEFSKLRCLAGLHRDDDCDAENCDCLPENIAISAQIGDGERRRVRVDLTRTRNCIIDNESCLELRTKGFVFDNTFYDVPGTKLLLDALYRRERALRPLPEEIQPPIPRQGSPRSRWQRVDEYAPGRWCDPLIRLPEQGVPRV